MNKRNCVRLFFSVFMVLTTTNAQAFTKETTLDFGQLGKPKIQMVIRDSALAAPAPLPVIVMISGFKTSRQVVAAMSETIGNNILIAFEYPLEDKINFADWSQPDDLKRAKWFAAVPAQIAAVIKWAGGPGLKSELGLPGDASRINAVAISLGIFFTPLALKLAQLGGVQLNSVVLAYAGAKLNTVVRQQLRETPNGAVLEPLLGNLINNVTSPFEPARYLPSVHPRHFLILNAADDQIFSRESQRALVEVTPEPKEVVTVPGIHIGLDQPRLINSTISILKNWLLMNGAINN